VDDGVVRHVRPALDEGLPDASALEPLQVPLVLALRLGKKTIRTIFLSISNQFVNFINHLFIFLRT
jgi:hypothetical protein